MTYSHSFNPPITHGSEWDHFVDDEARSRGIQPNDQQALEDLEDELRTRCEDAYEDRQLEVAYDNGLLDPHNLL